MRRGLAGLWLVVIVVIVSACGAPQYTYVASSDSHAYLQGPGWLAQDQRRGARPRLARRRLVGGAGRRVVRRLRRQRGAVGMPTSSARQTPQPFAFALVEPLSSTARARMSYNGLRDMFLPVTSATRQNAVKGGFPLTGFHLLRDSLLTPGQGVHGVRVIFDYTFPDGSTDTFDQVAFTNADDTEIYLLVLHCTASLLPAALQRDRHSDDLIHGQEQLMTIAPAGSGRGTAPARRAAAGRGPAHPQAALVLGPGEVPAAARSWSGSSWPGPRWRTTR